MDLSLDELNFCLEWDERSPVWVRTCPVWRNTDGLPVLEFDELILLRRSMFVPSFLSSYLLILISGTGWYICRILIFLSLNCTMKRFICSRNWFYFVLSFVTPLALFIYLFLCNFNCYLISHSSHHYISSSFSAPLFWPLGYRISEERPHTQGSRKPFRRWQIQGPARISWT